MSGRPDIIYCLVRRGHAVHYHSNRSVFERWLEKDSWQYPPDECEIIPYVPAYDVLSRSEVEAIREKAIEEAAENERLKQEIAATQEKLIRANDELIQRNSKALSRSEVDAIRDKALEEAAEIAQYIPTPADVQDHALRLGYISASQAIATAIRALKSGGDK